MGILIAGIDCWINNIPFPFDGFPEPAVQALLSQQDAIDWDQLLFG
jgi:hypothetical protein